MTQLEPADDEMLIDAAEVGKRLSVSGRTVKDWWRAGTFIPPVLNRSNGQTLRWRIRDVNSWIKERGIAKAHIRQAARRSALKTGRYDE
jgi:hypothetical protein